LNVFLGRIPRTARHKPMSPRRSPEKRIPGPKFLRVKSTTSVGSDTSEEEVDHDVKVRRLWMNRLRPRDKTNKTNTTISKGKGRMAEGGNDNTNESITTTLSLSKKRRTTTTTSTSTATTTKTTTTTTTTTTTGRRCRGRFCPASHDSSDLPTGSSKSTTTSSVPPPPSLKKNKLYPVRHSSRSVKPRIRS
jgi:hypothetical protein